MPESQYTESGLKFNLTDVEHFRFGHLLNYSGSRQAGVQGLADSFVKEMDFGFYWENKFYLLEIESFKENPESFCSDRVESRFLAKGLHSLLMMGAIWSKTTKGKALMADGIPVLFADTQPLVLIFALDLPPSLREHLAPLNDKLRSKLRGFTRLYDSSEPVMLLYPTLCRRFPFIQPVSSD